GPSAGGGRRPHQAFTVQTGNEVPLVGEGDGLLDLAARLVDNTTGVGVVGQQRADDLADGLPGSNAAARVLPLGEQTVAFPVGLAGESPEVDVDGLAAAQPLGQAGFA